MSIPSASGADGMASDGPRHHHPALLVAKGGCMGLADVIPGVSGGTIALITGIYHDLIDAIRSIGPAIIGATIGLITGGFGAEARARFAEELGKVHLRFLIPLAFGVGMAFVVGSLIIPGLMEKHPEIMRGLFFGLILASILTPLRMIQTREPGALGGIAALAIVAAYLGWLSTDPASSFRVHAEVKTITAPEGAPTLLKTLVRRGPSADSTITVYWSDANKPLRQAIQQADPAAYTRLEALRQDAERRGLSPTTDKKGYKAQLKEYEKLMVPAGTPVVVPRPSYGFILLAGAVAICAMVLPGISGSFLLLIFGVYFFIQNALGGFLHALKDGHFLTDSFIFLALFGIGLIIGLASFARVMSLLLRRAHDATMGFLVGLMAGCLRAVWPYRTVRDGAVRNALPETWGGENGLALVALAAGALLVVALMVIDGKLSGEAAGAET